MTPSLTAIVCTHNRASYLAAAVASLAAQRELGAGNLEIIVVDNASTDDTPRVIAELQRQVPCLRSVEEPSLGLSRARNAGWRSAGAGVVAYIDDDAIAAPTWARRILDLFATRPRPACAGGPVRALWEGRRPAWLSDAVSECFTHVDWGSDRSALTPAQWLAGCNVAFARDALADAGGFPAELGRVGASLLSMEDVAVQRTLRRRGLPVLYDPQIVVEHRILRERLNPAWVERRVYWNGVSTALLQRLEIEPSPAARLRAAAAMAGRLMSSPALLLELGRRSSDAARFERRCKALGRLGFVRGMLGPKPA